MPHDYEGRMRPMPYYPEPRERWPASEAVLTDRFARVETTRGFVTLGDTDAEVLVFSGVPERVELIVELFDAIITPRSRARSEDFTVTMRAGQSHKLDVSAERILARNAVAGSNARLQVIGRY